MKTFSFDYQNLETRLDVDFYNPAYTHLEEIVKIQSKKVLGDYIVELSGGATPKKDVQSNYGNSKNGVPFLRVQNIKEEGFDLSDVKYISKETHENELRRSQLNGGDLVVTITGRIATSAVVPNNFIGNINQHSVRIITKNREDALVIATYLNSLVGQKLALRRTTGGTRPALDYEALKSIPIVLNPKIVNIMQSAYRKKQELEQEAEELLVSFDYYILDKLGVDVEHLKMRTKFIVSVDELDGILSANHYAVASLDRKGYASLNEIASINPSRRVDIKDKEAVPYIGLPETDNKQVQEVLERPYKEVKGRNIIMKGDVLFARIEPSIFNKKFILADDLKGYDFAYTSTEFYVLEANSEINTKYLFALLFTPIVYNQIAGKTTGSTGRRRLDKKTFEEIMIPIVDRKIQDEIASEYERVNSKSREMIQESEHVIEQAKIQVEEIILGK